MSKDLFRCNVCSDVHYGVSGPEACPTCGQKNAYVRIDESEARYVMNL